jgi:putative peptidoglycan lipid II flippase
MYVLAMVFTGVLHAHRRFVIPAAAPLFSSVVVIGSYIAFAALGRGAELGSVSEAQLWILAGGTTLGVFVLTFCQLPSILRAGMRWRAVLMWSDPDVRRAIRAGMYGVAFFAVTAIGLSVTLFLANRIEGGVVAFRVAYAFYELPKALVGLPVAIALLPTLSERFVHADEAGFARLFSSGWRAAVFASVPAGVGLFVLGPVLSDAMLGAAPTAAAPELVGMTLRALALGVPAFVLVEPLARSFYARGDTRSPVVLNAVAVGAFVLIVLPITGAVAPTGADGLTLIGAATAGGQWLGTLVGVALLASRVPAWTAARDLRAALLMAGRAAVMGLAVWPVARWLNASAWTASIAGVAVGVLVYVALSARSEDMGRTMTLLGRGRP